MGAMCLALLGTIYDIIERVPCDAFYITRKWGRNGFQRILRNKKLQSFDQKAEEKGFMVVLYMRLMPFFPFDGVSYGQGFPKFVLGLHMGNAHWYNSRSSGL